MQHWSYATAACHLHIDPSTYICSVLCTPWLCTFWFLLFACGSHVAALSGELAANKLTEPDFDNPDFSFRAAFCVERLWCGGNAKSAMLLLVMLRHVRHVTHVQAGWAHTSVCGCYQLLWPSW